MCCSQFAGAELKNFSDHLWLKGSQALALGHFSAHDIMKVSQGWFVPVWMCLSCVQHKHNQELKARVPRSCLSSPIQTAVVALTPFSIYLIKQQFSAVDEVSEGPEWSPSEGPIPPKAQELPRGARLWNHCSTISSAQHFCEELQHLTCSICQNNCTSQWFLSLHSLF